MSILGKDTAVSIPLEYQNVANACEAGADFIQVFPDPVDGQPGRLTRMLRDAAQSALALGAIAGAPPPPEPPPRCTEVYRDTEPGPTRCYLPADHEGWHRCGGGTTWAPRLTLGRQLEIVRRREVRALRRIERLRAALEEAAASLRVACNQLHRVVETIEVGVKGDATAVLDAAEAAEDAADAASRAIP